MWAKRKRIEKGNDITSFPQVFPVPRAYPPQIWYDRARTLSYHQQATETMPDSFPPHTEQLRIRYHPAA